MWNLKSTFVWNFKGTFVRNFKGTLIYRTKSLTLTLKNTYLIRQDHIHSFYIFIIGKENDSGHTE